MKALRVLVVEDDVLIAMLLAELLAGMAHDVFATAATEAEAVIAAILRQQLGRKTPLGNQAIGWAMTPGIERMARPLQPSAQESLVDSPEDPLFWALEA